MATRKFYALGLAFIVWTAIITLGISQCQSRAEKRPDEKMTVEKTQLSEAPAVHKEDRAFNLRTAISDVARKTIPAVVHIDITQQREVSNPMQPFGNDPFFRFFFSTPQMPHKFKQELKGLGTGMLIDEKGHILTNNHVVAGATEINVLLADGTSYPAKVVGTDPKTDLAVIQIKPDAELPKVTFGDSDKMAVGDWVVAIGHPRGLDQTVTQGIISAKHRNGVLDPNTYQDYLQTDAAINPGNSGGPLLNLDGEVIGVNAAIESQSGGFEGIGFAIPSNMAVHVAEALMKDGKVVRGWLGVSIADLSPEQVKSMHLKDNKGALVTDVVPDSPARKAGLKKNDVVVEYQGSKIDDASALQSMVGNTAVGDRSELKILRKGEPMDLTVKVGNLEDALRKIAASVEDRLGASVRPLTENEDQQYGLPSGQGVAISSLKSDSVLKQAGFEKDDVIVEINNMPVEGVQGLVSITNALPPHHKILIKALDHRSGDSGYVEVNIG